MRYSYISYDWKPGGNEEEWESALGRLGLSLTPDPILDGSDSIGFFITTLKPKPAEMLHMMIKEWGQELIDDMELSEQELIEFAGSTL